jgi:hypothetical protein
MAIDLASLLPVLLPKAIAWAEREESRAFAVGSRLSSAGLELASSVGVKQPDRIRLVVPPALPFPDDAQLQQVVLQTGLLDSNMIGLTLGYAVFVRRGHEASTRLLSHEFRHVHQYETLGSIARFLPVYLQQIAQVGYGQAPFEIDARANERGNA